MTASLIPAGSSLLAYHSCDSQVEGGFTNKNLSAKVVTDPSRGQVLEATFRKGMKGGTGPVQVDRSIPKCTTLFVGFDLWLSPNWQGHLSGVNKVFHIWIGGSNQLYLSATGSAYGALKAQLRLQPIGGGSRNLSLKVPIIRGAWSHWDLSVTPAFGSLYVDGLLSSSGSLGLKGLYDQVSWNPTWGGRGDLLAAQQTMRLDALAIYGK